MRRTKEEAAETRQDILDAALRVFSRQGYQAARLQDIARDAGVTRGAIYHHFDSKANLYASLMEEAAQQGGRAIQQAIAQGGSFVGICARILVISMSLVEEDRRFREVMALQLFKTGADPELEVFNQMRSQQAEGLVTGIAGFMQQGIASGELRSDLDPFVAARAFAAYQNGVIMLWLTNREAFSIQADAQALADVFMRGIVAK